MFTVARGRRLAAGGGDRLSDLEYILETEDRTCRKKGLKDKQRNKW